MLVGGVIPVLRHYLSLVGFLLSDNKKDKTDFNSLNAFNCMAGRRKIGHINIPWTSYYHRQLIIGSLLIKIYFVFYQIEKK